MDEQNYERIKTRFFEAKVGVGMYDALDEFSDADLKQLCSELQIPQPANRQVAYNVLYFWKMSASYKEL